MSASKRKANRLARLRRSIEHYDNLAKRAASLSRMLRLELAALVLKGSL